MNAVKIEVTCMNLQQNLLDTPSLARPESEPNHLDLNTETIKAS